MPDCLASLEARRAGILRAIGGLGDLRAGSITSTGGRCGNPGCHCHRPGDPGHGPYYPGHGPYYRLTRKVKGKTVTETFATEVERRKAQGEVDEYHRFQQLARQLVAVSEQICRLRPVQPSWSPEEKDGGRGPVTSLDHQCMASERRSK